ncbi:hypothetical protein [Halococcus sp. PRR34]|uniref:hypothetical protein n=1 Tax=Halococcus sp. PRR34 TaxID=3020830 RepID=UPI002360AAB5|nr:hypothetical protein [Halococcus sp. PRR34]
MERTTDASTTQDCSETDGGNPETRCNECSNKWNESEAGRKCPECGALGHPRRSERADFGGGEGGIDAL